MLKLSKNESTRDSSWRYPKSASRSLPGSSCTRAAGVEPAFYGYPCVNMPIPAGPRSS